MKMKKLLTGLIAGAAVIGLMSAVTANAATELIYDAAAAGDLAAVQPNDNAGHLQAAGSPTFTPTGTGVTISDRTADWNALDVLIDTLPDGKYKLEASFTSAASAEFAIRDADGPYGIHESDTGTSVTLTHEFDVKGGKAGAQNRFRLQTNGEEDYTVTNVKIYGPASEAAPAAPPAATASPATGNAAAAILASVMALAGVSAVVVRKRK